MEASTTAEIVGFVAIDGTTVPMDEEIGRLKSGRASGPGVPVEVSCHGDRLRCFWFTGIADLNTWAPIAFRARLDGIVIGGAETCHTRAEQERVAVWIGARFAEDLAPSFDCYCLVFDWGRLVERVHSRPTPT